MAVKVLTDSTSYIDNELREELDIKIVSLYVSFPDESRKETEIDNKTFYEKMEKKGIPVSSQPSIGELCQAMKDVVANGDDLLGVFLSSNMSGTYAAACKAKEMVQEEYRDAKIELVDSRSNSMQLGFAAIVAARAAKEGKTLGEVKEIAEANIKRSRFLFIPDNLIYLQKGGRIGGAAALIGNLLRIIPVLTVENGVATVLKTVRTKAKAVAAMVDKTLQDHVDYELCEIVVHHINCLDQAQNLAHNLREKLKMDVKICDIGPVIGLHVGPGAIGVVYYTEKDMRG
ncbi:MAG: DegV family protein [Firmicutes bacterium]|nr:DegV family protein [Bacillota bacterium]